MRAFVVWLWLAGCSAGGRPLQHWMLASPGAAHATDISLPVSLFKYFGFAEVDFTLTTDVALAPDERGTVTLAIECFHGPLALRVDGNPVEDVGATGVGEHRFVIAAAGRSSLHLVLAGHQAPRVRPFATPPVLIVGTAPTSAAATFDLVSAEIGALVAGIVALLYAVLFVLDRRPEYGWISSGSAGGLVFCLEQTGLLQSALGRSVMAMAGAFTWLAVLEIAYIVFALGRPPRAWRVLLVAYIVAPVTFLVSPQAQIFMGVPGLLIPVAMYAFLAVRCSRVPAGLRSQAWILIPAYGWAAVACALEAITEISSNPIGGLHLDACAVVALEISQLIVLVAQHVARTRELDRANSELQRQVAARSKDLADALTKLANAPQRTLAADEVVDGRYRVLRKLGAGGMGAVHEVERIDDRKRLALKRIRGHGDPAALARFAREAQIAAELQHPNLVPVLDVGIADSALFLVMPLVDGSLDAHRNRFGDVAWAARIVREIASGLAALHDRGIVHRDLKPGNVLVADGTAKIADFGLAYFADAPKPEPELAAASALAKTVTGKLGRVGLTRAGDVFGTPAYMAPELANGVHAAGPATDIFSFGVLAFEMATGKAPFREPPIMAALAGGTPSPIDVSIISNPLREIISRCLAFDPKVRPTAAELVELLGRAIDA